MERIGPYPLEGELSRGGMGVVYRARDVALDRPVAVKVLLGAEWDQVDWERFQQEARTTARLRHPNVVGIHGAGRSPYGPWLALDLVEGGSLQDRLQRGGPLEPRRAARIARALADALAYAHRQSVVHRDVKPANVLLEGDDHPLLADFGLSKLLHDSRADRGMTATGEVVGSPAYMSPEQAAARHDRIGPATDVYGLGATLYAMLSGHPPFVCEGVLETLRAVEQDPPAPLTGKDPALAAICLRCLAKRPEDRYPTAFALRNALDAYLEPEAAPLPAGPAQRPARGVALGLGIALPVLGLALGLPLGWLLRARRTPAPPPPAAEPDEPQLAGEALDRFRRGCERGNRDDGQGAEEDFTRVLELAPDYAPARFERAGARLQREDHAGALADLERAAAAQPSDMEKVHFLRAKVLTGKGDHDAAVAELDRALALRPRWATAFVQRGLVHEKRKDAARARADFEAALVQDPRLAGAHLRLASLAFEAQGWERSLAELERALALDEKLSAARLLRARVRLKLGQAREAIADLDAVVAEPLKKQQILVDRAEARVVARDYELARRDAELALEVEPGLVHALLYLALAKEGQAANLVARGQRRDARPLLLSAADDIRRARALAPDDPDLAAASRVLLDRIEGQELPRTE
ncbi:MAG: protein kinase [Planctomycetota bacterium]